MGPDFQAKLTFEARVSPSEDPSKVLAAVRGVASGDTEVEHTPLLVRLAAWGPSLDRIHDQLRDRRVRRAARRLLLAGVKGSSTTIMLNRQAASEGVVALCSAPEESPLGPIYLTIESRNIGALIDWLTGYEDG